MNELAERIKSEIIADVLAGTVPHTVASFADLHDYVDANMYGGGESLDVDSEEFADFCERLNVAQNEVDAWIKSGGLHGPRRHAVALNNGTMFYFNDAARAEEFATKKGGTYRGMTIVQPENLPPALVSKCRM